MNTDLGYTDKLQFAGHEEGRIRAVYKHATLPHAVTAFEYDYMVKDHLGNVRMVLTEEVKEDNYPALSFEGVSGSPEINNQNAIWENAAGNAIDVVGSQEDRQGEDHDEGSDLQPPAARGVVPERGCRRGARRSLSHDSEHRSTCQEK